MKLITKTLIINVGLCIIIFLFASCGFAYEKHIIRKYYLIGVDIDSDLSLSYKISHSGFVGRVPPNVIAYGFNDTFLVAKSQEYNKVEPTYYIIDITKDSELAHESKFRIGPLSEIIFDSIWKSRLKIDLKKIE